MHKIIDSINRIFMKVREFIQSLSKDSQEFDDDELGIINPGQEADSYQIIVPRDYEFTEEEKLALLRTHDYIHLPLFAQEHLGKGE